MNGSEDFLFFELTTFKLAGNGDAASGQQFQWFILDIVDINNNAGNILIVLMGLFGNVLK